MDFNEAMDYLRGLTKFGINLGLGRIEGLLRRLGDPHRSGLKIVHIGGTNGKGSTTAMLSEVLGEAGYRVGAFTSPHLHTYTERYQINGTQIEPARIAALLTELRPHLDAMAAEGYEHPTEFEVGTALAFLYFSRAEVDYLLLEVGLGGAIDSTNVAPSILAVITNVSMDHMDYLGHTIKDIAAVKAGIIKPGTPVVTAATGAGLQVIEQACREKGCRLTRVGQDITWAPISHSASGQRFSVTGQKGLYNNLTIKLLGRHQQVNAATAIGAAENLTEAGALLSTETIRRGLAAAFIPGRLEIVSRKPLTIIDGAHNYEGARSLKLALADHFPGRDIVLVIGMLADKERARVVEELVPGAKDVIVTRPASPRSGDWRHLAQLAGRYAADISLVEDVGEALQKARARAGPEDLLCVTGSIYLVAEARHKILAGKS
ncbi:MAG: bifunctional folylpolyglutamate synthase/dihydrofolate synthase [Desulfotomaculaceae bacterium]|nr:bifunctional folylpolyglutamate synthase/dihydrofolate synthase [Desulfotomaculaceae bacterium]MDD4767467.1 bifunctional folylpolyglutamate synthase/dihydrofolate synthase [Desulfotomaculaceae bacterium]